MDLGQVVQMIVILVITGVGSYAAVALIQLIVKRLGGRGSGPLPDALQAELRDMRSRLEHSELAQDRIAELEERLDFAERMLAQQREAARLPPGEHS